MKAAYRSFFAAFLYVARPRSSCHRIAGFAGFLGISTTAPLHCRGLPLTTRCILHTKYCILHTVYTFESSENSELSENSDECMFANVCSCILYTVYIILYTPFFDRNGKIWKCPGNLSDGSPEIWPGRKRPGRKERMFVLDLPGRPHRLFTIYNVTVT